jgi:hypothetical protein
LRKRFDAALALRDMLEQIEPMGVAKRFCHPSKLLEQGELGASGFHTFLIQLVA